MKAFEAWFEPPSSKAESFLGYLWRSKCGDEPSVIVVPSDHPNARAIYRLAGLEQEKAA